jgi:hypothetical protein
MGNLFLADVVCIIYGGKVPLNLPLPPTTDVMPLALLQGQLLKCFVFWVFHVFFSFMR